MVKGFRPSLEPPAHRQVRVNTAARPGLCLLICAGVAALLLSAFAASGWNIYINRFDSNRFHFSSGDEIAVSAITNDFSSVFCESYQVKLWAAGQVYLMPGSAEVNTSSIGHEETISMLQVPGLAYRELSLYLLDQSQLSLLACRQNGSLEIPAEIVLIKGNANLRSWREDKKCPSCVERRVSIPTDALCAQDEEEDDDDDDDDDDYDEELQSNPENNIELNAGDRHLARARGQKAKRHSDKSYMDIEKTDATTPDYSSFNKPNNKMVNLTTQESPTSPTDSLESEAKTAQLFLENTARPQSLSNLAPKTSHVTFNYTVSSNDRYHLIISYGTPGGPDSLFVTPGVQLQGTVRRTRFNVKAAKQVCVLSGVDFPTEMNAVDAPPHTTEKNSTSSNACRFELPWDSNMDIVVHFGGREEHEKRVSDDFEASFDASRSQRIETKVNGVLTFPNRSHDGMMTKCYIRVTVWICLFGVLPVTMVLIFSAVIGLFLCRRRPQQLTARWTKRHRHTDRKKPKAKDGQDGLVDAEVLPEGAQSSMAIQGN